MSFGHGQLDVYRVAIELECGAAQNVLEACGAISPQANAEGKQLLDRIVAMLTRLGRRGYAVGEQSPGYRTQAIDPDADPDPDAGRA